MLGLIYFNHWPYNMLWRCKKSVWMTICCFRFLVHVFLFVFCVQQHNTPLVHPPSSAVLFIGSFSTGVFYYTLIDVCILLYFDVFSFVIFTIFCSVSCGTNSNTLWVKNMFVWAVIPPFCFVCFVTELFHSCLNLFVIQLCHSYIIPVIDYATLTTTKFEGVLCVTLHGRFSVLQCSLITFFTFQHINNY